MASRTTADPGCEEIVPGDVSGGTNTSHTIVVPALAALFGAVPADAPASEYEHAVLEADVLGKATDGARQRTFRYLRELYLLRPDSLLFRALRDLWRLDPDARPLLAGLCALAGTRCSGPVAWPSPARDRATRSPLRTSRWLSVSSFRTATGLTRWPRLDATRSRPGSRPGTSRTRFGEPPRSVPVRTATRPTSRTPSCSVI